MPASGQHHRKAALVRRRDHVRVAHRSAGMNHRGGASVSNGVEPVAKREERI
jgi:hypothetical protein